VVEQAALQPAQAPPQVTPGLTAPVEVSLSTLEIIPQVEVEVEQVEPVHQMVLLVY
jgi:hypothetical protein